MKYIFWQNILSIHQSAFIRNLAETTDVTIIVEKDIDDNRKKNGWTIPDFGNTKIIFKTDDLVLDNFFIDNQVVHVFTGINSFPLVYKAFKLACKNNSKIVIQIEPYYWIGFGGILRRLKYILLAFKYRNNINVILAISKQAVNIYKESGFNKKSIFYWGYFTSSRDYKILTSNKIPSENDKLKIIYVGRLDHNKNLLPQLPIINRYKDLFDEFAIYGDGNLMSEVKKYENEKIKIYGNIPNNEIHEKIARADFLILPSLYDGWGAVVNEALMLGTKVLCSNNCGASDLINDNRGLVFNIESNDFEEKFLQLLKKGKMLDTERQSIINWSNTNISGKVASNYFKEIINYLYNNGKKPIAPWMKE